ncbi:MAG TPA: AsmA-like C-terminal region-containing protein, partial [Candidatus Binatia bacterium]|nr:AsmA-like C-terminal region-containing protein [Candidatus Binatia bacterium]
MKWLGIVVAVVVLLTIVAAVALPRLIDTPRVQAMIASNAAQAVGRPVKFESLSVGLFPLPSIELHRLEVAEDPHFGTTPFLTLETGRIYLKLRPLLTGRVEFGDITLQRPRIALIQNAEGRLNVASLAPPTEPKTAARPGRPSGGATGGAAAAIVSRVKIDKGLITYVAHGKGPAQTPYRVEDLDVTVTGQGTQLAFKGALVVRPGDLTVRLADGIIAVNGAKTLLEAPVRAKVGIEGKDIEKLVAAAAGPTPVIAGPIKGDFSLGGTLGVPKISGNIELASVRVTQANQACPEPKQRTLALGLLKVGGASWDGARFQSRPVTTSVGGGPISTNLTLTLDHGARVQLSDLAIKSVPAEKVLVDFLCQGYAVSGPLDLTGALSTNTSDLLNTLGGSGQLRIGPGKVVGPQALALITVVTRLAGAASSVLAADVPRSLTSSPVDFDSITGTYQITNGVLTTKDLLYTAKAVKVGVVGDYGL